MRLIYPKHSFLRIIVIFEHYFGGGKKYDIPLGGNEAEGPPLLVFCVWIFLVPRSLALAHFQSTLYVDYNMAESMYNAASMSQHQ